MLFLLKKKKSPLKTVLNLLGLNLSKEVSPAEEKETQHRPP